MKRVRNILLAIMAAIMATACGESRHIDDSLARAEAVMQEHPDSALALLQAIDTDDLSTGRGRALHALLLSQAYDKNYIDLTDDSLISIAVDHFASSDDHYHAMLAHYYHGRVLFNADSLAESSVAFLEAEQYALKQNDNLYLGMIYAWMSSVYNSAYNHEEELKCAQKSLEYFKKHADEKYIGNATFALAQSYNNTKQFDEAKSMYEDIIHSAKDSMLRYYAIHDYAHTLYLTKEYKLTKKWIITLLKSKPELMSATKYGELAMAYLYEDKQDSAMYYLSLGEKVINTTLDSATIAQCRYSIAIKNKDYESALKARLHVNKIQDNTTIKVWQQAVVKSQRDYLDLKTEKILTENKSQKLRFTLLIIILSVVILCVIFYNLHIQLRNKLQSERLRNIITERDYLDNQILIIRKKISIAENELTREKLKNESISAELLILQKDLSLYETQLLAQQEQRKNAELSISTSIIIQKFQNIVNSNQIANDDAWSELNEFVLDQYPLFQSNLYRLHNLSILEYRVCLLIKCHFSPTDISRLINRSKESVSSIRRRLYFKIHGKKGSPQELDQFILSL